MSMNLATRISPIAALAAAAITITIAGPPAAQAAEIRLPDADSVLLWRLDETAPDTAPGATDFTDATGNAHHGNGFSIAADQVVMGQPGILGKAVQMVGPVTNKRNFVHRTGTVTTEWTSNSFTFEGWVMTPGSLADADAGTGRVIAMSRDATINWSLGITSTGALKVFSNNAVGIEPTLNHATSALTWTPGVWYYLALVSDDSYGTADQARWTIYRATDADNQLTLVDQFIGKRSAPINGFTIGGDTNTADDTINRAFHGFIDEAHFSDGVRSEAYLLQALPEPGALAMLLGGAVMTAMVRRRGRPA